MKKKKTSHAGRARSGDDLDLVRELVRILGESELSELELADDKRGLKLRLRRGPEHAAVSPQVHFVQGGSAAAPAPAAQAAPAAAAPIEPAPAVAAGAAAAIDAVPFPSPMVGTFYRSSSPEAEAFVDVGSQVEENSVLCIIEAMKVMNEIRAELRGEIVQVLVENGEPVEFGQPLFLIRKR